MQILARLTKQVVVMPRSVLLYLLRGDEDLTLTARLLLLLEDPHLVLQNLLRLLQCIILVPQQLRFAAYQQVCFLAGALIHVQLLLREHYF